MSNLEAWRALPLGEVLDYLERTKEVHWHNASVVTTGSSGNSANRARRAAGVAYGQTESVYTSLNRVLGYLALGVPPEMPQRPPEPVSEQPPSYHADPCPACGKAVQVGGEGVVWTCPADRQRGEPGWLPRIPEITSEMQDEAGVWSNCGSDFGLKCYAKVPLHGECHDRDFIVYATNPANNRRAR